MLVKYRSLVNDDLADPDGALIFDESGFLKKAMTPSAFSRQYWRNHRKSRQLPGCVFAGYVSGYGYALADKRLYIPEKWFDNDYSARRKKCKLPDNAAFRTKPQLAAEMLTDINKENILPFKYVLADSIYGEKIRNLFQRSNPCRTKPILFRFPKIHNAGLSGQWS